MAHTPGPWRVRTRVVDGNVVDCFVAAPSVRSLPYDADILGDDEYDCDIERKLSDAHLIAAAPQLLAALKSLVAYIADTDDEGLAEHSESMIAARQAIAKAEAA